MISYLEVVVLLCLPTAIVTFRGLNGHSPNLMPFTAQRQILPVLLKSDSYARPQISSPPMLASSSIRHWIRPPPIDFDDDVAIAPRHILGIPPHARNGGYLDLASLMGRQEPSVRFGGRQFGRQQGSSSFLRPQISKSMLHAALMRQYPKLNDEEKFWLTRDQKLIVPHGALRLVDDDDYDFSNEKFFPTYSQSPRRYPKMRSNRYDPEISHGHKRTHHRRNYYDQRRRHRTNSDRDWFVDGDQRDFSRDDEQLASGEIKVTKRKKAHKNQSKSKTVAKAEKEVDWQLESDSVGLEDQNLPLENENINGYDYENLSEEANIAPGDILRVNRRNMTNESH